MKNHVSLFVNALLLAALTACSNGGSDAPVSNKSNALQGLVDCNVPASGQAVICGTALAEDGVTPLAGAEIRLISSTTPQGAIAVNGVANSALCQADANGDFACLIPTDIGGTLEFTIVSAGFTTKTFSANVVSGQTIDVGPQNLTANNSTQWLVVPGLYDGVQVLLAQLKGCTLNSINGGVYDPVNELPADARGSADCTSKGLVVLDDDETSTLYAPAFLASTQLSNFDALFINCDADYSAGLTSDSRADNAIKQFSAAGKAIYFSDLSSSWLESLFPGKINFLGGNTLAGSINADVVHTDLAGFVGTPIEIIFDLIVWSAIDTVDSSVTTFIQGDISSLSPTYTGIHPITVGWKATPQSGCVFYTSYHIEGASTGAPQELAIKYLLQNFNRVCS